MVVLGLNVGSLGRFGSVLTLPHYIHKGISMSSNGKSLPTLPTLPKTR